MLKLSIVPQISYAKQCHFLEFLWIFLGCSLCLDWEKKHIFCHYVLEFLWISVGLGFFLCLDWEKNTNLLGKESKATSVSAEGNKRKKFCLWFPNSWGYGGTQHSKACQTQITRNAHSLLRCVMRTWGSSLFPWHQNVLQEQKCTTGEGGGLANEGLGLLCCSGQATHLVIGDIPDTSNSWWTIG